MLFKVLRERKQFFVYTGKVLCLGKGSGMFYFGAATLTGEISYWRAWHFKYMFLGSRQIHWEVWLPLLCTRRQVSCSGLNSFYRSTCRQNTIFFSPFSALSGCVVNPDWYIPDPATTFLSSEYDPNYFKHVWKKKKNPTTSVRNNLSTFL